MRQEKPAVTCVLATYNSPEKLCILNLKYHNVVKEKKVSELTFYIEKKSCSISLEK